MPKKGPGDGCPTAAEIAVALPEIAEDVKRVLYTPSEDDLRLLTSMLEEFQIKLSPAACGEVLHSRVHW